MNKGLYGGFPTLEAFAEHYRVFDPRRPVSQEEQLRRINWPHLVARAQEARESASSYRNFRVGCAVRAFKTDAIHVGERWAIFTGSNFKAGKDARPVCAEQFALGAAKSAGHDTIIAMIVVGEPQPDVESGLLSKTLHPCGECRRMFQLTPEINPDTLLLMLTPDEQIQESFLMGEFIALHRDAQKARENLISRKKGGSSK